MGSGNVSRWMAKIKAGSLYLALVELQFSWQGARPALPIDGHIGKRCLGDTIALADRFARHLLHPGFQFDLERTVSHLDALAVTAHHITDRYRFEKGDGIDRDCDHPATGQRLTLDAPLPPECATLLSR